MSVFGFSDLAFMGAVGGSPLWTPANITTALWLDAADANTLTTVSDAVSQWNDKSGNGRNALQGTAANRPTLTSNAQNGLSAVTFNGSSNWLSLANDLDIKTAHTIIVAARNSTTITASTPLQYLLVGSAYAYPSTTTSELLLGVGSITGNLANERLFSIVLAHGPGAVQVYGYGKTNADITGPILAVTSFNTSGNAFVGRLNGVADFATVSSAGGFSSFNTMYPSTIRNIGSRLSSGFWNGQIWEIIVLGSALSLAMMEKIEGYLAWKWGLTANLPSNHPYKTVAPTP